MALKRYQERVVDEVKIFLKALILERAQANRHAVLDAWGTVRAQLQLATEYRPRRNGLGNDLPTFTLKERSDRRHFYRESLEHAASRRIEVWEKYRGTEHPSPARHADRLYVIERGEIIFAGKSHEVWQDAAVVRIVGHGGPTLEDPQTPIGGHA